MAKIVIEFDTVEKTVTASVDGNVLANVVGAEVYQSYSDDETFRCNVTQVETDAANKMAVMHRICASQSVEGKAAPDAPEHETIPGFKVIACRSRVEEDIKAYFKRGR